VVIHVIPVPKSVPTFRLEELVDLLTNLKGRFVFRSIHEMSPRGWTDDRIKQLMPLVAEREVRHPETRLLIRSRWV